jgi:tRNA (guanine-N7-)-methyltransferase
MDRTIPLDAHFVELAELQPPWSAAGFFGRSGPLEIELGCGKGLFLLNASQANPRRLYLGLEISKKYGRFAAYRLARQQRSNARIIRGDGMRFMSEFAADRSVEAVHVYFPDPWWKERHRRRRIINPQVVRDIQRVLQPQGLLHFWTDVEEYFESACEIIRAHSALRGPLPVNERPAAHDMDYRTHFERRMRLNEHSVFRSQFRKP